MSRVSSRQLRLITALGLFLSVILLSIAYAVMSTSLLIKGTAKMESASWDVHFGEVTASSVGDARYALPMIQDTTLNNFNVTLTKPGDAVTYNFKVINSGNIAAILNDFVKNEARCSSENNDDAIKVCNNLVYNLTYSDGTSLEIGDNLPMNSSSSLKLTIEYPRSADFLPTTDVYIDNLGILLIYNQK